MASEKVKITARFESWLEFRDFLAEEIMDNFYVERGRYLFRGHGNFQYQLMTTFDREFSGLSAEKRDFLEEKLIENFRKECEAHNELKELLDNEKKTLALAQHFGLPTRLLDWSDSPYVASYFAFQNHLKSSLRSGNTNVDVAIWVLDTTSYIWSEKRGVQVFTVPAWRNMRLRNQSGWFTLSRTPFTDLESYVSHFENSANALRVFVIDKNQAVAALADLDLMGINHAALFPGISGTAKAALAKTLISTQSIRP